MIIITTEKKYVPQSLSQSQTHNLGMQRPFLQENSVSGSQGRFTKIKNKQWLLICIEMIQKI